MSPHPPVETIETHGCSIVLRRVEGPEARELFFGCQPPAEAVDAGQQAEAIYQAVLGVLEANGGSFGSVVSEMVFLRDLQANVNILSSKRYPPLKLICFILYSAPNLYVDAFAKTLRMMSF